MKAQGNAGKSGNALGKLVQPRLRPGGSDLSRVWGRPIWPTRGPTQTILGSPHSGLVVVRFPISQGCAGVGSLRVGLSGLNCGCLFLFPGLRWLRPGLTKGRPFRPEIAGVCFSSH